MSNESESPVDPAEVPSQDNLFPPLEEMSALLPQYEFMGRGKPPQNLEDWKGLRVRAGGGLGTAILSTSTGVITGRQAAERSIRS